MVPHTDPRILPVSFIAGSLSSVARIATELAGNSAVDQYLAQFGAAGGVIIIAYAMLRRSDRKDDQARSDLIAQLKNERERANFEQMARQTAERQLMAHLEGHHLAEADDR